MLLVLLLLWIEARRYRFFDVYRARVRMLERHYFAQILAPGPDADPDWARLLAEDLRKPRFLISRRAAMSRRLRRNYIWMFLILALAWMLKISSAKLQEEGEVAGRMQSFTDVLASAALGPTPGWLVVITVGAFYIWLVHATFRSSGQAGELAHGDVHV